MCELVACLLIDLYRMFMAAATGVSILVRGCLASRRLAGGRLASDFLWG